MDSGLVGPVHTLIHSGNVLRVSIVLESVVDFVVVELDDGVPDRTLPASEDALGDLVCAFGNDVSEMFSMDQGTLELAVELVAGKVSIRGAVVVS